jgi:4-hydroxy-3-methylbut-2-enyl diphosphate reductase
MDDAVMLARYITGALPPDTFYKTFEGRYSEGFDVTRDLQRIGVVNQTTQLATDTQAIADFLRQTMKEHYVLDESNVGERFADTRDTLCYATNDNQSAVTALLETPADFAIVTGGYNSSNTTHLVELCEQKLPVYFINAADKIISEKEILHYDYHSKKEILTADYLSFDRPVKMLMTSGASCPDAVVEAVIRRVAAFFNAEDLLDRYM